VVSFVHLLFYVSPFLKAFLLSLPALPLELPIVVSDAFLRAQSITTDGSELAFKSPYSASWFMQLAIGGVCGGASTFTRELFNLWGPSGWRFTSDNLAPLPWDIYGAWILSATYIALRGTHPAVNNVVGMVTAGSWGVKGTVYLGEEEAHTVVALIHATVVTMRRLGIYSFALGKPTQVRMLNGQEKKFQ
jgi:hypothetical protein